MTFESEPLLESKELAEFRKQWKEEVEAGKRAHQAPSTVPPVQKAKEIPQDAGLETEIGTESQGPFESATSHAQTSPPDALEYYLRAVANERQGNLNAALINYRQAFKLNSNVDALYKQHYQNQLLTETQKANAETKEDFLFERHIQIGEDYEAIHAEHPNAEEFEDPLNDLLQDMKQLTLSYSPLNPDKPVPIAILPDELVLVLFKNLILRDIQSIGRLARSCKKFLMLSRDSALWKFACLVTYKDPLDKEKHLLQKYHQSWRQMYIDRPRLRLDGVYISTCYYLRPGSSESSWQSPIHMVTYYRYLRFFNDGTCIKLLTTDEPGHVVKNFKTTYKGNSIMIEVKDRHRLKNTFFLSLNLKSTTRGKHNKLSWNDYYSEDSTRNFEQTQYSLKHFKSFFFSRVRSYNPMQHISI
ncbi:hypothetical protein K493DRAFT_338562 [Basidiobolus meristosporus CBS 931.73]|uniref:F-box domain-containing protein n=1 Tax=Basidiobolus meristosporus CBS 931.73 TaxID=1314790 RepID=A0A1Y1Y4T3_9FUNG|nr:hypothetical protein K493DRAFT_338562 [Basidiobolus meristosporus CBS 931.73]|eukprot:ORX92915.1 hypothetical protein K493DRAFT_338562 [Basidiobolus meristosporus CBS 931.73]